MITSLSRQQLLDCRNPRRRPVSGGSGLMIFVLRADHNATDKRRLSLRASLSLAAGLGYQRMAQPLRVRGAYGWRTWRRILTGRFPRG